MESSLYILVPQTVDERIQHRGDQSIEDHHHLVLLSRGCGSGLHVGEEGHPIRHGDHSQVGGTGLKGFVASLGRSVCFLIVWVLGIELSWPGLVARAFTPLVLGHFS